MMKTSLFAVLALALASAGSAVAGTVYNNTTNDTLVTYFYTTGNYSQIGDSVVLGGTDRTLTDASVQFYNNGTATSFNAILRFFNTGGPVGTQIGSAYTLTGLNIGSTDILTVTFSSLNLFVPTNLVFTVEIQGAAVGSDIGLNAFEPPSVGSSNNAQIILRDATTFSTGSVTSGVGNLYFLANATTVPEPSTMTLAGAGVVFAAIAARRRRRNG